MPNVVSYGGDRGGPQIQAPVANLVAQRMGPSWGGAGTFALLNPLYRRKFGIISGGLRPDIGPNSENPLGQLGITPEGWAQNKQKQQTTFDTLQGLVDTRNSVNQGLGLVNQRLGAGTGAGYGTPSGYLRKLLMQQGAMY